MDVRHGVLLGIAIAGSLSACAGAPAEMALPAPPAIASAVQDPPLPRFPAEEFERRRRALIGRIGPGLAILLGAPSPATHRRFRQEHNVYYLSGVEAPGAALILDGKAGQSHLFLPELSPGERQWEGDRLEPGAEATRVTGIRNVHRREEFDGFLRRLLAERTVAYLPHAVPEDPPASPDPDVAGAWQELAADPWIRLPNRNLRMVQLVRERFPKLEIRDLSPLLFEARWAKTPLERDYMRRTGRIGALGVAEAIRSTRPGLYEWEVAAAATFVYDALGQAEAAFAPILASGPNVNTIHYTELSRRIAPGDMLLLDYGSDYGYYKSDVTRTWTADGRFTPEQLEYYRTVQMIRDSVIAVMRPGVTERQLLEVAQRVTAARGHGDVAWTTSLGYIGHWVGLALHDPDPPGSASRPFVPGVVYNVEPIIDIPQRGWHFRLEDTVLITETGHEVLTSDVPVEPAEVERLYHETGVVEWWHARPESGAPATGARRSR